MTLSAVRLVNPSPCSISVFHQQDIHQIVQVGFDEPGSVAANVQDERGAHDICVLCMHYYECRYRSCASTKGGRVAPTLLVYMGALPPFLPLYLTRFIKIHSIPRRPGFSRSIRTLSGPRAFPARRACNGCRLEHVEWCRAL